MGLRSSLKVNRVLSLRMHGRVRGKVLRPGTRSDHMNPQLEAGNCRTVEGERKGLRNIMDKLRGVYHRRSRPRREENEFPRSPRLPGWNALAEAGGRCWHEEMLMLMQGQMLMEVQKWMPRACGS